MPHGQLAKRVADAIDSGSTLDALARELLDAIGPITRPVVIDIGARLWLVVSPGFGPLSAPADFVAIGDQMT